MIDGFLIKRLKNITLNQILCDYQNLCDLPKKFIIIIAIIFLYYY